ncbi:MAG: hypothetical protein O8C66_01460 [Candidatus Methanoperedens sp.]|nr:hypothetical protein [Candidatus Methanoperedens sp.]MCZ7369155.1 hypothetical protein [Candidatus Methanoperedens sp.]
MKNEKIQEQVVIKFLKVFKYALLFSLSIYLITSAWVPTFFDLIYGEEVINHAMARYIANTTDPDKKALAIMGWEKQYFYNPYSLYNPNSTAQKFGIFNVNGDYRLFGARPAPVSWIIYSRLANCEEYARVFVTMMNKAGIESRLITAPGEDHAWAEYMHDGYRIAVDPSQNYVIGSHKREFEKIMSVKFSYLEAIDPQGNKIDASDEYIKRGNLTIVVLDNGKPVSNAQVMIQNPYLMESRSDRYKKPIPVLLKSTGNEGTASFKLGYQKYNVTVRVNHIYLLDSVYQKNVTVKNDKENVLDFNLEDDEKNNELFISRIYES